MSICDLRDLSPLAHLSMTETIHSLFRANLPDQQGIEKIEPVSESRAHAVWKVTTNKSVFAVKHHLFAPLTRGKPYDLLAVEQRVTDHLLAHGVSVPRIITADPDTGLVVCEWCGDQTLDDLCQTTDPNPFARNVIHTLLALGNAFHHHPPNFASRIAPGCDADALREHWQHLTQSLGETLPTLATHNAPDLLPTWTALAEELARAAPALGPTDYNARNIACSNMGTTTILELAKIGYDWPERRLIQYTTSLGAHHPKGRVVSLLTPALARHYANSASKLYDTPAEIIHARLDAHHLIYHLSATRLCLSARSSPWQNIDARIAHHLHQIAHPLSEHPLTCKLRAYLKNK